MIHPSHSDLLEYHFEELDKNSEQERYAATATHVSSCSQCQAFLSDLNSLEVALSSGLDETPPADGLERVLTRVAEVQPAQIPRNSRWRAILPSFAAIATGVAAVVQGGVVGALVFFLAGALVTLAIAPVLILESQQRAS